MTPMTIRYKRVKGLPEEERLAEAKKHLVNPSELVSEIDESVAGFSTYENCEAFYPTQRKRYEGPAGTGSTRKLAALLKSPDADSSVPEDRSLSFNYIDREIKVARTTDSAHYETPEQEKATTGITADLLLRMSENGAAAIGEVKVGRDKDPYLGLIQGLACACQLATPNQLARLRRVYPDAEFVVDRPVAVLVLLTEVPAREGTTYWHELHKSALELASAIDCKAAALGRVGIVEVLADGSVRPSTPVAE